MNFLNPLFLIGLAAVAVPILIHIFTRRRLPEIPFSTLRFLKASDRRSMRRINLRRLLLLVLRITAVALLALAFARPVVRGGLAALFPPDGSRAVCILLDRSYSMGVEQDEGSVFERGKRQLESILDNLERNDEVTVILFDNTLEALYEGRQFEREAIVGSLRETEPAWSGTELMHAIDAGRAWLLGSRRVTKELYVISDFQRSALRRAAMAQTDRGIEQGESEAPDAPSLEGRGEREPEHGAVRTFLVPVQPEPGSNVAIERVLTPRSTLHRGELAEVTVVLRNMSKDLPARFPLEMLVEERRITEKEIEIRPGGVREETITFPVERIGWVRGEVRKRKDRLSADDRRHFVLHVRERLEALLIADASGFYLAQALGPDEAEGDIELIERDWRNFTTADLDRAEALILGPGRGPAAKDVELFDRFVSSGGRALVIVTPELADAVDRLSAYPLTFEITDLADGFISLERPSTVPRFLAPFGEEDIDALLRMRFNVITLVRGVPDRAVHLKFRNGAPFIWEEDHGDGWIVFACLDPRPGAGDITLSPYFLPLVQQAVLATGPVPPKGEGALIGDPIPWEGSFENEPLCRLPDGTELKPETAGPQRTERATAGGRRRAEQPARGGRGRSGPYQAILIPPVLHPGFVTVIDGSAVAGRIAVNPDCTEESDLEPATAREAADSLGIEHFLVLDDRRSLALAIHSAREGREISVPLILVALALFIAELVVAQSVKGAA